MSFTAAILNAYDHRNLGDRAIIEAQVAWIESKVPDVRILVFSSAWKENQKVFGKHVSHSPPITVGSHGGLFGSVAAPVIGGLRAACNFRTDDSWKAFRSADAYFLCGGGYLYSSQSRLGSRQMYVHVANSLLALAQGKPVMQFPQSWGPFNKMIDRAACRHLARKLAAPACRGKESIDLMKEWGMKDKSIDIPDIVLAMRRLRPDLVKRVRQGNNRLGIAPVDHRFSRTGKDGEFAAYLNRLRDIATLYFMRTGGGITIFTQVALEGADDDYPVALQLAEMLTNKGVDCRVVGRAKWKDYWSEVAAQSVFVGCRMHACIFALVSAVPTIGLAYQPKFQALFSHLKMDDQCFDISNFDPEVVATSLIRLASSGERARDHAAQAVEQSAEKLLSGLDRCAVSSGFSE